MHYTISYHLAQDRIAGLRHHAQRASLARAARRRAASPARAHRTQLAGRLAARETLKRAPAGLVPGPVHNSHIEAGHVHP